MEDKISNLLNKIAEETGQPENKEEVKKEEIKQEVKEEKKEEKKEEPPKPKAIFERLKEKGVEVNSEEEVENYLLNSVRKLSETETRALELEKQINEYAEYKKVIDEGFDPLSFFPSTEDYKAMQLKKQFPNLDTGTAKKIFDSNVSQLSPEEVITLDLKVKYPTLNEAEIKEMITEKYGESEERSNAKTALMKIDAAEGEKRIEELKSGIKEPSKIDPKAAKQEQDNINAQTLKKIEEDWTRESNSIMNDSFSITETVDGKEVVIYTQNVEGDFKVKVAKEAVEFCKANKIPFTKEAVEFVRDEMVELYKREHFSQILKKHAKDEVAKAKEQWDKENTGMGGHVSRQADGSVAPIQLTKADIDFMKHGYTEGSSSIKKIKYD